MKHSLLRFAITTTCAFFTLTATAAPILLGIGSLNSESDLSGLTGNLESGIAKNIFGGLGSGLAYAGNNTFLATPDRGPNAQEYQSGTTRDYTTSYISRFQTVSMQLTQNASGLPFSITSTLNKTTLLYSASALHYAAGAAPTENTTDHFYFTGRSDNFEVGNSSNANNARLDPESIRVSNDGSSVFISDEYGPYLYQFDRMTGERIKTFTLPNELNVAKLNALGANEISDNTVGRVANKGMEGLAITPDGKTLVGIMQAPLLQDINKVVRMVTVDIASGATHQYAYSLTSGTGVSEIVAINNHEFLIDERDGKGLGDNSNALVKQAFKIDLNGAQDIAGMQGSLAAFAVTKTLSVNMVSLLNNAGIEAKNIPAKIEGMAFGEDVVYNNKVLHTLWITNDNDFLATITDSKHPLGFANSNNFYVIGLNDSDLQNFVSQKIKASEPGSFVLLFFGFLTLVGLRRHRS